MPDGFPAILETWSFWNTLTLTSFNEFHLGKFVVHKTNNEFSGLAIDQTHEQAIAVVKGDGGVTLRNVKLPSNGLGDGASFYKPIKKNKEFFHQEAAATSGNMKQQVLKYDCQA